MSTNIQMLEIAAGHLEPLLEEVVFVGGATIELWVTDPLAPPLRATADVDVIVEISTRRDYYRFEKRVRKLGFENDHESRVICRFHHPETELVLDVMPTKASILGFENRWLIDGRGELPAEVAAAPKDGRAYISRQLEKLSLSDLFDSGLEGALAAGPEARERVDEVIWPRVRALIGVAV